VSEPRVSVFLALHRPADSFPSAQTQKRCILVSHLRGIGEASVRDASAVGLGINASEAEGDLRAAEEFNGGDG
jgi:hypothetical protein